ncbi:MULTISPECIES: hypothetical protein [unclassified Streptomyces]|uniref:hypothetical protein n=1 Tax=unclassified Streptomyces TaxID=2593676 RepID=UPI003432394D
MVSALLSILGGLLLPVAVLMLIVGRRMLFWGPDALELPWQILYLLVLAVLFLVIGFAAWTDSGCGAECQPVVTPVLP